MMNMKMIMMMILPISSLINNFHVPFNCNEFISKFLLLLHNKSPKKLLYVDEGLFNDIRASSRLSSHCSISKLDALAFNAFSPDATSMSSNSALLLDTNSNSTINIIIILYFIVNNNETLSIPSNNLDS